MKITPSTRRSFLKKASAGVAAFTFVPRHVLGGPRFVPPSEKVNIAMVGAGTMGDSNVLALLQEWPQIAQFVGEGALDAVTTVLYAMQKSPNSGAMAPLLQTLCAVARRLQGPDPLNHYLRIVRDGSDRARLLRAFEEVDAHFAQLFATLFEGGRANRALDHDVERRGNAIRLAVV